MSLLLLIGKGYYNIPAIISSGLYLLVSMEGRTMKLTWATRITILRILLIIPFIICMLKINDSRFDASAQNWMRYVALSIFVVMAVSDGIDGYLARSNHQVTQLGTFLDPTADKLLITCAALLLASGRAGVEGFLLPPTVVVIIVGKDVLLLIGFLLVYFLTGKSLIRPVFAGKASTTLQLCMVGFVLIAPEISRVFEQWIWVCRVIWWSTAATAILSTIVYIRSGIGYIEEFEQSNGINGS